MGLSEMPFYHNNSDIVLIDHWKIVRCPREQHCWITGRRVWSQNWITRRRKDVMALVGGRTSSNGFFACIWTFWTSPCPHCRPKCNWSLPVSCQTPQIPIRTPLMLDCIELIWSSWNVCAPDCPYKEFLDQTLCRRESNKPHFPSEDTSRWT